MELVFVIQTVKGNTPLNTAVKKSRVNVEVVKELLKYGSDINTRNRECRPFDNHSSPLDNGGGCRKLMVKWTLIRNFNDRVATGD